MFRRAIVACIAALSCLAFVSADVDGVRNWSDATGSFSVEATLLDFDGEVVRIEKTTGEIVSVPFGRLSKADQDFVRSTAGISEDPFAATPSQTLEGLVVGVTDGDTITVLDGDNVQHKIRLDGIDAPESGQDYGQKSKAALSGLVFQKDVRVRWREKDKYGRTLGSIYLGDRWINRELVEQGWAWRYDDYSRSKLLKLSQDAAKESKLGLWADANEPVPPWIFRHPDKMKEWNEARLADSAPSDVKAQAKAEVDVDDDGLTVWQRRAAIEAARARSVAPQMGSGGTKWLNTSSDVRHNSGCRHFGNTKSGRYCGPSEGRACGICGG